MAGLYDNYQLANSTAIPLFEGSAGDDFVRVGQYKQGLYDTNAQNVSDTGQAAGDVSSIFHQDQGAVQDLQNSVQSKIEDMAKRGDYENMSLEARRLGMDFANRRAEIMAPQQAFSTYKSSLDNKELNLTPEQKAGLLDKSLTEYQGLTKDARGRYVGTFSGMTPAKNIDVPDWVDKRMKDIAIAKGGESMERDPQDGDFWIVKNGVKWEKLSKNTIANTLAAAMRSDSEYQAYTNMEGELTGHYAAKSADPNNKGQLTQDALAQSKKMGTNFQDEYRRGARNARINQINTDALDYAINKYQRNNVETERSIKDDPYTLKNYEALTGPYMIQGPDNKLTNDEKDYDKLSRNVSDQKGKLVDLNAHITALNKQLTNPNLAKETRTQVESDLAATQQQANALQQQANRGEDIQNYSKMTTAQKMGYQDYDDFLTKNRPDFKKAVLSVLPNGLTTKSGRHVSVDELTEAAQEGRITPEFTPVVGGNMSGTSGPISSGISITLKDGTKVPIQQSAKSDSILYAVNGAFNASTNRMNEFNTRVSKEHEDNVKDFAIQSTNIAIPTQESRDRIKDLLMSNKDNIRFSHPGQLDKVDAPDNFRVVSIGTAGIGADTKLQVEELDKDNKPTGKVYDATTSNANISENLAREFGRSDAPEAKLAGDALAANSGARQVQNLIPGQSFSLKNQIQGNDGNLVNAEIKVIRNKDKTISYVLRDAFDGSTLKSTGSAVEAGRWVDEINGTDTYSNGRKKLIK